MRTAEEIYTSYGIPPSLALHQLRVAAVGKLIAEEIPGVRVEEVVLTCLFHDMGNLIKTDFSVFPDFFEKEGIAYWENMKASFVSRWGSDSHAANVKIAREIGLPHPVPENIDQVGFRHMERIARSEAWEPKIFEYADCRVGPRGILPLTERFAEGRARYQYRRDYDPREYEILDQAGHEIEQQLFAHLSYTPADITDARIAPIVETLRSYPIP